MSTTNQPARTQPVGQVDDTNDERQRDEVGEGRYGSKVVFADDDSRLSYEISAAVERALTQVGPEPDVDNAVRRVAIAFPPASSKVGNRVLFYADDFMHASHGDAVFHVLPRTIRVLEQLCVPFDRLG